MLPICPRFKSWTTMSNSKLSLTNVILSCNGHTITSYEAPVFSFFKSLVTFIFFSMTFVYIIPIPLFPTCCEIEYKISGMKILISDERKTTMTIDTNEILCLLSCWYKILYGWTIEFGTTSESEFPVKWNIRLFYNRNISFNQTVFS